MKIIFTMKIKRDGEKRKRRDRVQREITKREIYRLMKINAKERYM